MTAPNFGGKVTNEKTNEEGTPRGPFLPDGAFPCALLLGAIVFRIAMRAVATCVTVVARLFRQRGIFSRQMPDGTRFRHAVRALRLLRHSPHLLRFFLRAFFARAAVDTAAHQAMVPWKRRCTNRAQMPLRQRRKEKRTDDPPHYEKRILPAATERDGNAC